jgi:hypothetical protein
VVAPSGQVPGGKQTAVILREAKRSRRIHAPGNVSAGVDPGGLDQDGVCDCAQDDRGAGAFRASVTRP